jgi:NNP family nitrate/nitrite transporter-like MFS transporter
MGIGLAQSFETFLMFRLLIGAIGASFVITQYHTSVMFAPRCVGTANATTAGWGNLGGGVTQFAMPLVFAFFVGVLGTSDYWGWRLSMVVAGGVCLFTGIAYYLFTQDTPEGDFRDLRAAGKLPAGAKTRGSFLLACRDQRTWLLFVIYGACFGVELTLKNIAALYFVDYFGLGLKAAGFAAAAYGLMNLFARTLGGYVSDRWSARWGLAGRTRLLFLTLLGEGLALILFSQVSSLWLAIVMLIVVGLFVQMSNGGTYAVVPFINRRCLGSVAGIVGAGGNVGAVLAGLLFQGTIAWPTALLTIGVAVLCVSSSALLIRPASEPVDEPKWQPAGGLLAAEQS